MKNVLVTGGAGYIGSHTCKLLAAAGYLPITYDDLSTGHAEAVLWGPLIKGNLHNTPMLTETLKRFQPLAVIHFAASAYVGESVINPFKYYQNNVGGTLSLLEAMKLSQVNKIVFSSTCATYGVPDLKKIDEKCPQNPINPYGHSKLMIEKILGDLAAQGQINQISLRYFNAAGADEGGLIGERHDPETHLIPLAILSASTGAELKVFGTDFNTPDGTAVRDYVHVEDLGRAHILALEYLLDGGHAEYINLGTGQGHSVRQIISSLRSMGVKVISTDAPKRLGDPAFLVADSSKAKSILKWNPKYTKIDDLLKTAINWHQTHG
jgi:UDP-glucose-4-epimerase GalE